MKHKAPLPDAVKNIKRAGAIRYTASLPRPRRVFDEMPILWYPKKNHDGGI